MKDIDQILSILDSSNIRYNCIKIYRDNEKSNTAKILGCYYEKIECTVIMYVIKITLEKDSRSQLPQGARKLLHNDDNICIFAVTVTLQYGQDTTGISGFGVPSHVFPWIFMPKSNFDQL